VAQLARAVDLLARFVRITALSSLYRTEPVGILVQPPFFNLVLAGETPLPPLELLRATSAVENAQGRTRGPRFGPRHIDIDILAVSGLIIETPALTVPHPRLHERPFVLVPLVEIAPHWRHPVFGRTASELLGELQGGGWVERAGELPRPSGADR
jgi:2-amino-4-hydroxy-6-hydroxymethyldihydropteridine diphosphokinase